MKTTIRACLALLAVAGLCTDAPVLHAQPVSPKNGGGLPDVYFEMKERYPDAFETRRGYRNWVERIERNRTLLQQGKLDGTPEELARKTAVSGTRRVPVMLGQFSDTGSAPVDRADLQQELFDGPWPTGTMTEFYSEISYGMLSLDGTVYDWVTVSEDDDYYTGGEAGLSTSSSRTDEFITEILEANDSSVDFGQFDNDGPDNIPNSGDDDGYVDFIGIVHPEAGSEEWGRDSSGNPVQGDNFWSHRWSLSNWSSAWTSDDPAAGGGNIKVDDYTIMPSVDDVGDMIDIGVFCHEFGHAFGLPDYYDTNGGSQGIGHWGLMGSGNWNTPESPAHMSAYAKAELGWLNPANVDFDLGNWPIASSTLSPTAYRLWSGGATGDEYFLVEYRTQDGFDAELHGEGLLVWHVDLGEPDNEDETHKLIDLECADQSGSDHTTDADDLDDLSLRNRGDADDPFCDGDTFASSTNPSSVSYSGDATTVRIDNIEGCGGGELVADLIVGQVEEGVNLCMRDCAGDACAEMTSCGNWWASPEVFIDNDGDGIIDAPAEGLENRLMARVRNVGASDANDVDVDFYFADPAMGLLFPSTGTLIGSDNIPVIGSGNSELAEVLWEISVPPADVNHWCVGVIAENALDGASSEYAPDDNNLAQINVQELVAKAGSPVPLKAPPSKREGTTVAKRDTTISMVQTVQICAPNQEFCDYEIVFGSPPEYDDVTMVGQWDVELSTRQGQVQGSDCLPLQIKATNFDPHHLDELHLPITLLCQGEPAGGDVVVFSIDNLPPENPCSFEAWQRIPFSDTAPGEDAVELSWPKSFSDVKGWPEMVERFRIHEGIEPGFEPTAGNLVVETAIDETPGDGLYHHFLDSNDRGAGERYFQLIAIDRAGNASEPCLAVLKEEALVGTPDAPTGRPTIEGNTPNPFNPSTRITYRVAEDMDVRLEVLDIRGRRVRELVDGYREAGQHSVVWDGRDDSGMVVASGSYLIRLSWSGGSEGHHVTLLK